MKTDRRRLIRQFFCSHASTSRTGYTEFATLDRLPRGWEIEMNRSVLRSYSPWVCDKCGYVDADMTDERTGWEVLS